MRILISLFVSLFIFFASSFDAISAPSNFTTKGQAYQACMSELHRREAENPWHESIRCSDDGAGYYRCYAASALCYASEDNIYFYNQSCRAQPSTTITGSFSFPGPDTFCYMGCEYSVTLGTVDYLAGNASGEVCETDTPLGGDGSGGDDGDGGGQGEIDNPGDGGGDDGGSTGGGSGTGGGNTGGGGDSGGGSTQVPGDSGGSGSGNGSGNNGGNGNGNGSGSGTGQGSEFDYSGILDAILGKLTELKDWLSGTDTGEADTEDDGIGPSSFWKKDDGNEFKLDTSGFGYSRSCPKSPSFNFRGKTYTFDVSPICSIFIACGYVVIILASLWAVRVMVRD